MVFLDPATEKQKSQVFFMEPEAKMELNAASADPLAGTAALNKENAVQSDYAQDTAAHD